LLSARVKPSSSIIDGEFTFITTDGRPDAAIIPASVFVLTPDGWPDAAIIPASVFVLTPDVPKAYGEVLAAALAADAAAVETPPPAVLDTPPRLGVGIGGTTVVAYGTDTE
jgi:hypothetical protein